MSRSARPRRGIPAGAWFGAQSFHHFLTAPVTSRLLDGMIEDNAATDAAILAAREEEAGDELSGSTCGTACGFCGRCS